jgi:heme exporter protein D
MFKYAYVWVPIVISAISVIAAFRVPTRSQTRLLKATQERDKDLRNQERIQKLYEPLTQSIIKLKRVLEPYTQFLLSGTRSDAIQNGEIVLAVQSAFKDYEDLEAPLRIYGSSELYLLIGGWVSAINEMIITGKKLIESGSQSENQPEIAVLRQEMGQQFRAICGLEREIVDQVRVELELMPLQIN